LWPTTFLWDAKNVLKVKKIAILIEDIAGFRGLWEGLRITTKQGVIEQRPLRDIAKDLGLEVVYEARFPAGEKMFLGYLEPAYAKGAELIYVYSSWYTDCVTLTKQWANSRAKDSYLIFMGGPNMWTIFWDLTGGAALGVITPSLRHRGLPTSLPLHPELREEDAREGFAGRHECSLLLLSDIPHKGGDRVRG
jgi:hypothetical protein